MEDKFNFNSFSSFIVDGKKRDISELRDYLIDDDKNGKIVEQQLGIGDKVKLKGRDYTVIIKYINYNMPGIGVVDYAGIRDDGKGENLLSIFNQSEIEKIIAKNENEINKEERIWKM